MELGVTFTATLANPDVGDLALTDAGLEVVRTELADEVAQRLHVRFKFFRGEWFLNTLEGTPWFQLIFVKSPRDHVIRSVFGALIRGTEGVSELVKLNYSINSSRQMSLTFQARLQDGTLFRSTDYGTYVLAV